MKSLKYIIFIFLSLTFIKGNAQNSELNTLIKLYDQMYYNRTGYNGDSQYNDSIKCRAVYDKVCPQLRQLMHSDSLRTKYPFAFYSALAEFYALTASNLYLTEPRTKHREILLALDSFATNLNLSYKLLSFSEVENIKRLLVLGGGNLQSDRAGLYNYYLSWNSKLFNETIKESTRKISGNESYDNDLDYLMDIIDVIENYRLHESAGVNLSGLKVFDIVNNSKYKVVNMGQIKKSFPELYNSYYSRYFKLKFDLVTEGKIKLSPIDKIRLIDTLLGYDYQAYTIYDSRVNGDANFDTYPIANARIINSNTEPTLIWPEGFKEESERKLLLNIAGARVCNIPLFNFFVDEDSLKGLSNRLLLDTMIKLYTTGKKTNKNLMQNVEEVYAMTKFCDVRFVGTDSLEARNFNTIQMIYCYFKCRDFFQLKEYDSASSYFIKYLLIDLNQKGIDNEALWHPVSNLKQMLTETFGTENFDSMRCDTALWNKLWNGQFSKWDREGDGVSDYYDVESNSKAMSASPRFPWPPPKPTASIKTEKFSAPGLKTFDDASKKIKNTLSKQGYGEWRYYSVPGGFAMVAPMEQIVDQGKPADTPPRWDAKVSLSEGFSWSGYFKALFFGDKGKYRVMVFIITDRDLVVSKKQFSLDKMTDLMEDGGLDLTKDEKNLKYTRAHDCYILIYEFEKSNDGEAAVFKPKGYTARQHLQNSKIWNSFFK